MLKHLSFPLLMSFLWIGPSAAQGRPSLPPPPALRAQPGIVIVANGSGDFRTISTRLGQLIQEEKLPLCLETFVWSHGLGRFISDHTNHKNQLLEGRRLAEKVVAYRKACPCRPVYLIGHSAGCAVVLAAVEALPPGYVERVILLAPSVSLEYDLRPALRSVGSTVEVFYSRRDVFTLGLCMRLVGTADRKWSRAAGNCGFKPVVGSPEDACLYGKLRQHSWDACVEWTGNHGGHYGTNRSCFLKAYVVPLLLSPCR
jgi:pimeloyl-ACP methyl ester carboxylesterase